MIKVCGMREPENIRELSKLPIDLIGGIFYRKSPRYIGGRTDTALAFKELPPAISPVGVFVNEDPAVIFEAQKMFSLKYIQLHGAESPQICCMIRETVPVFKAFGLSDEFDFSQLADYTDSVELFIFDTSCREHGGSGRKFNWEILERYTGSVPFLLSGGIGPDDHEKLKELSHPCLAGFDLNSGFETAPAYKNISALETFLTKLR